jgi:hypothetical protein
MKEYKVLKPAYKIDTTHPHELPKTTTGSTSSRKGNYIDYTNSELEKDSYSVGPELTQE